MRTIPTTFTPIPGQERRIANAYRRKRGCRITAKRIASTTAGKRKVLLTPAQFSRYHNDAPGETVSIPFRHRDLVQNADHKGGFLPLLLAALAPVLGGVVGGVIEKEISGSGIHQKGCRKKTVSGSGMRQKGCGKRKVSGSGKHHKGCRKKKVCKKEGSGMYLNPYMGNQHHIY